MTAAELEAEIARQRALYEYWKRWAMDEGLLPTPPDRSELNELI
jgi:hypothetical protein